MGTEGRRLRIVLQGDASAVEAWAGLLEAPGVDVVRGTPPPADDGVETLAICFTGADAAPAATPAPGTPAVVLTGGEAGQHPLTRLLRDIVRSKSEIQGVFDAMLDPAMMLDGAGVALRGNRALALTLAQPVTAIASRPYLELLGAPQPGSPDPIASCLESGTAETVETRYSILAGTRLVTTSPLLDEDGEVRGAIVTLKDMTELKEQQERLVRASRLADVGQLAAGVAHEINTPLASIGLRAESLLRSAEDPRLQAVDSFKNFARYLRTIGEEIQRCKRIINALLEFSRSRRHELIQTDLNAIAESAADLLGHEVRLRRIELVLSKHPGLPLIQADPGQIRQVLLAVLMNGIEATPPGGRIEIATQALAGGRAELTVCDTGPGIPAEHRDRIFSPFFTTKPLGQATGLGLAVCHGVVSAHGGEIHVSSGGSGTRVTIELPVAGPGTRRSADG